MGTDDDDADTGADAEQGGERQRWTCVDCGTLSPETETPYTLISAPHGWRVVFVEQDGKQAPLWRCAACWHEYRSRPREPES